MSTNDERKRLAQMIQVGEHLALHLAAAGHSMAILLGDVDAPLRLNRNGPTDAEAEAYWNADTLARTAKHALQLHRVGDGPGPADYARACIRYADALRVAAAGRWPQDLDEICGRLHEALHTTAADARLTARGALRAHGLDQAALRSAGSAGITLAGRIEHECRHELAELRRIATAPSPQLF